jgi:hypothetical protein
MSQEQTDLLKEFEAPSLESLDSGVQQRISLAKGLFTELGRLMKSITLYGPQHQSTLNFRDRFFTTMTSALEAQTKLTVDVLTYALTIAEQVVYEDPKIEGNFIYRFYTDGVRQLSFERGITAREVDQFLDLCLLDWSSPQLFEDDAITMLWTAQFDHISYRVAPRYDEGTEEAEEHLFSLTEGLDRLQDILDTSPHAPHVPPFELSLDPADRVSLESASRLNERELLEKLITVTQVAYRGQGRAGRGRSLELIDQIAQLFAQRGDISALERYMRQALKVVSSGGREAHDALLKLWCVPLFVQRVMGPLEGASSEHALSSMACLQLLGAEVVPHMTRSLNQVADSHMSALSKLLKPHLASYSVDVCRSIRNGGLSQATRLVKLAYESGDVELSQRVFETAWGHEDRGVRDEALRGLPEALKGSPVVLEALFTGLQDPSSKIRSYALASLSQQRSEACARRLAQSLDSELSERLEPIELCKLYAAAGMAGAPQALFSAKLSKGLSVLKGKGGHTAALVGLACASSLDTSQKAEAEAILDKEASRLMASASDKEAARWGLAYLRGGERARAQLSSSLFFRGLLTS